MLPLCVIRQLGLANDFNMRGRAFLNDEHFLNVIAYAFDLKA